MNVNRDILIIQIALEIHVQTTPDTVKLVNVQDDFQALKQYIDQLPIPEILPAPILLPTNATATRRRTESNLIKNYNRAQNTKYNLAMHNYKGRKR